MMGQLNKDADRRQQGIENPMFLIGSILATLDHDSLRVRQAIRRTGLDELLGPVLDDHESMRCKLRAIQAYLRLIWEDGQENNWTHTDTQALLRALEEHRW
jgi:hypothetical protein